MLSSWGYQFEVLTGSQTDSVDESVLVGEDAKHYVTRVTQAKAQWGVSQLKNRKLPALPVLAADTTVALDHRILGKPFSIEEAMEFLRLLSGREHQVITAICLIDKSGQIHSRLSSSVVKFIPLSAQDIGSYVKTGEPMDKAGAYAIQGKAGAFIDSICGSYTSIMGLPQKETVELLTKAGINYF